MYVPSKNLLGKYADVLVNFALNGGEGVKEGEVVYLVTQQAGIPLAKEVYRVILQAGGHPLLNILDDQFKVVGLTHGTDEQLTFFPTRYYKGLADTIDHWIRILADEDPMLLSKHDPRKIILQQKSVKPFREWLDDKENKDQFTWTLALYGTEGMAQEAGLSIREYWNQIAKACFLRDPNPIKRWREAYKHMHKIITRLNKMEIDRVHITAPRTDLWVTIGESRRWVGGRGRNIPSFEIFTSPDWRGTEGTIFFDQPLYRYGNIIKDISLDFKAGKIVRARAGKNQALLRELIKQENADRIGEFSMTDVRFSKISKFMANTLYDENYGGKYGNTHLAVGKAYAECYDITKKNVSKKELRRLGFNDSPEHTDIIATTNRRIEAVMRNGSTKLIYADGKFTI